MLDVDLARIYGVETRILNQAVNRNSNRFPDDFMFQLNDKEAEFLRSQIGTSKVGRVDVATYRMFLQNMEL